VRAPFRLPERHAAPLLLALLLALLAASAWMSALGRPLVTPASPSGILAFELAGTAERSAAILASWDDAARAAARRQTFWDYALYIPLYVIALSAWAAWGARRLGERSPRLAQIGVALAWAMPVAGLLDALENAQLLAQLEHGADGGRAALAAAAASLKFAIVLATVAYGLAAAAASAARRLRHAPE
jgi:hypothetical protein